MAQVPNWIPAAPELFIAVMIMALLMFGVFQKHQSAADEVRTAGYVSNLSVTVLALGILITIAFSGDRVEIFNNLFVTDPFAVFTKVLVLIGAGVTIIMAQSFLVRHKMARFEYPILILFAVLGMMMMISANNLMALYLGLELQSLSLYVIASFQRDDARSTEAGLKYFVLGALASGMLLYGMSLIYGFTGSTDFVQIAQSLSKDAADGPGLGIIFGIVFILAGLAFKVSAVPFHMWTPDVYEGAPTPVTAFFAIAPKIAALALFMRVMIGPFGGLVAEWQQIVVFISMASMLLGAFAALSQTNIKRLMAYSSIGHVGYALIGIAAGTEAGIQGVLIYLSIYLVMNLGTFACILCMRRGDQMVELISDLAGLGKTHKMLALAFTIFMFSMAGIPPLAGFIGKLYIFMAAINAELYALAIVGVLASVVSSVYYLRIVKIMYFDDVTDSLDRPVEKSIGWILTLSGLFVVVLTLIPGPIMDSAKIAAASLFAG
ncbi:MAG: NADH-quinone oxidoreductase subunit NuoN [Rhodospirillales bacterium]|nr:NADH-quinone oxidoreductase subunit NuoN [Rhodospirillales bacterium]